MPTNHSFATNPRHGGDSPRRSEEEATYEEQLQIALALSISEAEAKEPKQNLNPYSRSAVAVAKEEDRLVHEAVSLSLAEEEKLDANFDHEVQPVPIHFGRHGRPLVHRSGVSPFLQHNLDQRDLPEFV